jgi:hypothetical protein
MAGAAVVACAGGVALLARPNPSATAGPARPDTGSPVSTQSGGDSGGAVSDAGNGATSATTALNPPAQPPQASQGQAQVSSGGS